MGSGFSDQFPNVFIFRSINFVCDGDYKLNKNMDVTEQIDFLGTM